MPSDVFFCAEYLLIFYFQDRSKLSKLLDDTENWLYEEGEDETKTVYVKKLEELKVVVLKCNFNESYLC